MNTIKIIMFAMSYCIWFIVACFCFSVQTSAREHRKHLPAGARIVLAKASTMATKNNYDQAIKLLNTFQAKALSENQEASDCRLDAKGYHHPQIYYYLGFCYLMKNQYKEAKAVLEKTVQLDEEHLPGWLNLAKTCYELHDYTRAAESFTRAYALDPEKNTEILYYSAVAYLLAERYPQSLAVFDRILADHAEKMQPEWRENLIHALLYSDQPELALPHIQQLAEQYQGEKKIKWQEILLHQYLQLGMNEQAMTYAGRLVEQAPTQPKWWKALTYIYLQQLSYAPTLTALIIDSYLEPLSQEELTLMADLYLQLGIPSKAASQYQVILQDNSDLQLLERLVLALRQLGKQERALAALDSIAPQNIPPSLLMQKADLLYELGRYDGAAELYAQTAKKESREKDRALQMAKYAMLLADRMDKNHHEENQKLPF